ncbi:hypothetical protein [Janthinobacterium psychrotolerans]|uniref:DUF2314 domain-containing protein n=1 Tax=Janthinobacterium psychrotolerans TaxID=1747903 RepID=A0A1A7C4T5_9BURK|nr:hypothetical protein [Janthinobacterium psychrotolerans]OBV39313.1 hypothetical protein ASR47_1009128 [Janthinobacterium psychrotolerans]
MINPTHSEDKLTAAWQFPDAPDTACYATTDVMNGAPVQQVYHDYDGDWQFHGASHDDTASSVQIVSLAEMVKHHDLLTDLHDLPYGWRAQWNDGARNWDRFKDHPFPTFADHGYYLEDAVWLARYLTDIQPPPAEVREHLGIACHVKIVFRFAPEEADRGDDQCERLWVEVTAIDQQNDGYLGRIDNHPHHAAARHGDLVSFHSLHVAGLYSKE